MLCAGVLLARAVVVLAVPARDDFSVTVPEGFRAAMLLDAGSITGGGCTLASDAVDSAALAEESGASATGGPDSPFGELD